MRELHTSGPKVDNRKKHEAWADLIAAKVLFTRIPDFWAVTAAQLDEIGTLLGPATHSHPSGQTRVKIIKDYVAAYNQAGSTSKGCFSRIFCCFSSPISTTQARENAFKAAFKKIATGKL
ncbi:hypothetical protein [Pseudomonas sp. EA_15y_Pfl2_R67]|uniref:hypothetical protein n=1 Tax=Pseudomonas sp. EA_15y_Pfl2_R67 TaxID=3088687 RepID=UPI0030DACB6B